MITKFGIGEEVYIRAKVISIAVDKKGTKYKLEYGSYTGTYDEECIVGADVEDFRRENPSEKD